MGIPNNRRLWVCACMDERLPVDDALGIRGDVGCGGGLGGSEYAAVAFIGVIGDL